MKKTGIILICLSFVLVSGCKKKPTEPINNNLQAKAQTPTEVSVPTETLTSVNTESVAQTSADTASEDHIEWMTDFSAAQKKAKEEGKDLFINFTGSDWCIWCKRLDKEVFSQKIFIYEAQKRFVFVYLDFPRNKPQSDAIKAQNEKLAQMYDAQGFPTIILATADGKPYGQMGYEQGGPLVYLQKVAQLQSQRPAK